MTNITYRDFLDLVDAAVGAFSYCFAGSRMTCDPRIYLAIHCQGRRPAR